MIAFIRTAWRRYALEPLAWVDTEARLPPGRLSPDARATVVFVASTVILALMSYGVLNFQTQSAIADRLIALLGELDPELGEAARPYHPLFRICVWSVGAFTLYFCVPALIIRTVFGHRLADYGLTLRGVRGHLWVYLLLFLPVLAMVLLVADAPDFQAKYPFYREPRGLVDLLVWEGFYAMQFFSLEFFFRGFMIHGVKDKLGRWAIFMMVVPYTMIHFSKPFYESLGAIGAGAVLGLLSLRTGSIFGGVLIHVGVAFAMDFAALYHRGF